MFLSPPPIKSQYKYHSSIHFKHFPYHLLQHNREKRMAALSIVSVAVPLGIKIIRFCIDQGIFSKVVKECIDVAHYLAAFISGSDPFDNTRQMITRFLNFVESKLMKIPTVLREKLAKGEFSVKDTLLTVFKDLFHKIESKLVNTISKIKGIPAVFRGMTVKLIDKPMRTIETWFTGRITEAFPDDVKVSLTEDKLKVSSPDGLSKEFDSTFAPHLRDAVQSTIEHAKNYISTAVQHVNKLLDDQVDLLTNVFTPKKPKIDDLPEDEIIEEGTSVLTQTTPIINFEEESAVTPPTSPEHSRKRKKSSSKEKKKKKKLEREKTVSNVSLLSEFFR